MQSFISIVNCMVRKAEMCSQGLKKTGCRNWKNALGETGKLASHTRRSSHLFAAERFTFSQKAASGVDEQLSEVNEQQRSREQVER
jgi:Domain of unknown function (DUF4371)